MSEIKDGRGRPTLYSEALADLICSQIAQGKSVVEICAKPNMPCKSSVFNWLEDEDKKYFLDRYWQAHKIHLLVEADELKFIADNAEPVQGEVAKAALQIKTRMWRLAKLEPLKYGDKPEPPAPAAKIATIDINEVLTLEEQVLLMNIQRKLDEAAANKNNSSS